MKKRKKTVIDEGPWLFSEDEMAGKIENVTVIQPIEAIEKEKTNQDNTLDSESTKPELSLSFDERIVYEMAKVLRQMNLMSESHIRLIALSTTMTGQDGLDLSKAYNVPIISDADISGYELTAWCYCCFMEAFPNMADKLKMPYSEHYVKAKAML